MGRVARIYISSTYDDLKECRERVYRTLRQLHHDVRAMEDYVAMHGRPLQECLDDVRSCEIYVGIFAFRAGYVPEDAALNPHGRSITQLEYEAARDSGKPCLIFLLDPEAPWPSKYADGNSGDAKGAEAAKRIAALRDHLKTEKLVSFFQNRDDLARLVGTAVTNVLADPAAPGSTEPTDADGPGVQPFRQITGQVLIVYSEVDSAAAQAWAKALQAQAIGLRVRLSPKALLAEQPAEVATLEREAIETQSVLVVLSPAAIDQLRTRPEAARRVFTLLEARTGCSLGLASAPLARIPADWPFSQVYEVPPNIGKDPVPTDLSAQVFAGIETRCPVLSARVVVGLPFMVLAMTADEASLIEQHPEQLDLSAAATQRFAELQTLLETPVTEPSPDPHPADPDPDPAAQPPSAGASAVARDWTSRYGKSRLDWRPLGGSASIRGILDDTLGRLNAGSRGAFGDRRIKLQYYPFDPIRTRDPILRPLYTALGQAGCIVIVDELSLFHPVLKAEAQSFLNQPQVSVITVAPMAPARGAVEQFLDSEARRRLGGPYDRFDMDFDPRCELGVEEERRLRRWLHRSLPDTLRQMRQPPPDRSRLAEFKRDVRAETQGVDELLFPSGSGR